MPSAGLPPNTMFRNLAKPIEIGLATVLRLRRKSYAIITEVSIAEINRLAQLAVIANILPAIIDTTTSIMAFLLAIRPEANGLFGRSFLSISKSK